MAVPLTLSWDFLRFTRNKCMDQNDTFLGLILPTKITHTAPPLLYAIEGRLGHVSALGTPYARYAPCVLGILVLMAESCVILLTHNPLVPDVSKAPGVVGLG